MASEIVYVNVKTSGRSDQNSSVNNNVFMAIIIHSFIEKVSKLPLTGAKIQTPLHLVELNNTLSISTISISKWQGQVRRMSPLTDPRTSYTTLQAHTSQPYVYACVKRLIMPTKLLGKRFVV